MVPKNDFRRLAQPWSVTYVWLEDGSSAGSALVRDHHHFSYLIPQAMRAPSISEESSVTGELRDCIATNQLVYAVSARVATLACTPTLYSPANIRGLWLIPKSPPTEIWLRGRNHNSALTKLHSRDTTVPTPMTKTYLIFPKESSFWPWEPTYSVGRQTQVLIFPNDWQWISWSQLQRN